MKHYDRGNGAKKLPAISTAENKARPTPAEVNALVTLLNTRRYAELESNAQRLIERYPNDGVLWKFMSAALQSQNKDPLPAMRMATQLLPNDWEAHNSLGYHLWSRKDFAGAVASCRRSLEIRPNFADALNNLGNALKDLGQYDEALASYRQALQLKPDYLLAHFNLGNLFRNSGRFEEAVESYRQALAINPNLFQALSNLGTIFLRNIRNIDQALVSYQQAVNIAPNIADLHNNLGNAYKAAGRLDEAIACFRRASVIDPRNTKFRSNLLYTLTFHSSFDEQALLAEAKLLFGESAAVAAQAPRERIAFTELPQRRLRIGYVSPDFREHCQALFTMPLLSNHDHSQFEVFCYADLPQPDSISQRLSTYADVWRSTYLKSDAQLAEMIAQDQIDILVDLTMHMENGRPLLFVNRAAPIQVAWLAYPGSTGIPAIDYRFTDPWLDPVEHADDCYSETSIRLADTFWCYDPLIADLQPNELPALKNGHITFGSLNNFCKVNDATLSLWGELMSRIPSSSLILLCDDGSHRQHVLDVFATYDIDPQRIEFAGQLPRAQYLQLYHRIDICLDTLPYNGHTTSLDAYWMGVPVVTLVGKTVVGRAGWSQLNNVGLPELAAFDAKVFVDKATTLAADLVRLSDIRRSLRKNMEASPLMDGKRFALAIEAAYRDIVRRHSARP